MGGELKRVLITGAGRGIGRETALQLSRRGFHVIVTTRDRGAGEDSVAALRADGGSAEWLQLDVSDSGSIATAAWLYCERHPRLDVLINNAGVYPDAGLPILTVPRPHLAGTFQTNTFGPLEVVQQFLGALRRAGAARVINVSSVYGQLAGLSPGVPSYCLSKLALNGLTLMLAAELKREGIAVNSVCPGWVRTAMGGPDAPRSIEQGADTIVWLASEADPSLTGRFFQDRQEIAW